MLKSCIAFATRLIASRAVDESKDEKISKHEHLEVLHVLNVVNLTAPYLSTKLISKVLSEVHKLFNSQILALSRHVLKTIEAIFVASRDRNIVLETEDIVVSLASFVSLGDKNPLDAVIFAATILRLTMDLLYTGQPSLWIKNLPLVCRSVIGIYASSMSINCVNCLIVMNLFWLFYCHYFISTGYAPHYPSSEFSIRK